MESLQGPESYSGHHCIGQLASKQLERPSTSEATLSSQLKLACHIRPPCGQKLCPACKQVRRPADSLRPNPTTNPKKPRRRHKCHSGKHAFAHRWPPPCPKKIPRRRHTAPPGETSQQSTSTPTRGALTRRPRTLHGRRRWCTSPCRKVLRPQTGNSPPSTRTPGRLPSVRLR